MAGYKFKRYKLSTAQLEHIAGMCAQEQGGSVDGVKFEASLAANLYESGRGKGFATINDYIRNSGWFAASSKDKSTSNKKLVNAVKDVLVNGNRVLPPQIDEHDWTGDIKSLSTGGDKTKRSSYKQFSTVVHAISTWTFYCWPKFTDDPFGTTNVSGLKNWLKKYAKRGQYFWGSAFSGKMTGGGGTVTLKGGEALVEWAKEYTYEGGNKKTWYGWGKSDIEGGIDCSGFVSRVYGNFFGHGKHDGLFTKNTSMHGGDTSKYAGSSAFYNISRKNLKPGDIIVQGGYHIGLYADEKTIYHSTTPGGHCDSHAKGAGVHQKKCDAKNWMPGGIARRYKNIDKAKLTVQGEAGTTEGEGGNALDMKQRIAKLYSSDNYQFVQQQKEENNEKTTLSDIAKSVIDFFKKKYTQVRKDAMRDIEVRYKVDKTKVAVTDESMQLVYTRIKDLVTKEQPRKRVLANSLLSVGKNLVEAPFVQLEIAGKTIGTYRGESNTYPNYISGLTVSKINGELNTYTINLVYQVRAGEDPNRLDKLFSANQFNPIKIYYGDLNASYVFEENGAVVTNITSQRDYVSNKINYVISATSAGTRLDAITGTFAPVTSKPSTQLSNLMYESQYSSLIKSAYPGMANKTHVFSRGLIPTNDSVVNIMGKKNISINDYMTYLVSIMSTQTESASILRNSIYMIQYYDDINSGSSFAVKKITAGSTFNNVNSNIFEVDINYPDDALIYNFNVSTNNSWAIMYDKKVTNNAPEYFYDIDSQGNIQKTYSPNITKKASQMSEIDKNWWSYMVNFPVKATLTMRGLLRSSYLTDYIIVNAYFYGIKHYTSGLYTIVGQEDTLNGSGFKTTLSLVKVGE